MLFPEAVLVEFNHDLAKHVLSKVNPCSSCSFLGLFSWRLITCYLRFFQGLFSRITFREPLFVGGAGNTTGLADKLPVEEGLKGCIRHLEVNDHVYNFNLAPLGDSIKGFDVDLRADIMMYSGPKADVLMYRRLRADIMMYSGPKADVLMYSRLSYDIMMYSRPKADVLM
uniref:Laminin G domain-containing protein n=1 Tax=Timema douglasi TaxID=61478 RepID=A0A7R8ZBG1_TIMDO|nr:unnamed protein product [Timema douglasi]